MSNIVRYFNLDDQTDGSFETVTFSFYADSSYSSILGQDLGIIIKGATTSAIYDNIKVSIQENMV